MNRQKSTLLIAAGLLMFLSACAGGSMGLATNDQAEVRRVIAPLCPTPTPQPILGQIERELAAALGAGVSPDALAREWERLDTGARACRRI